MYQILATKMVVGTAGEVTQAVGMSGSNAVTVEVTVYSGTLAIPTLQGSNDLENWVDIANLSNDTMPTGAYYLPKSATGFENAVQDVATQYVRVKFASSTGNVVLAAGINTASL